MPGGSSWALESVVLTSWLFFYADMRHQLGDRVQAGVCVQSGSNRLTWPQVDSSQGAETSQRWSWEIAKDLNTYVNAVIQFFLTKCVSFHLAIPQYWQQTEYINTSGNLIDYSAGSTFRRWMKLVLPHPLTPLLCTFSAVCDELSKKKKRLVSINCAVATVCFLQFN